MAQEDGNDGGMELIDKALDDTKTATHYAQETMISTFLWQLVIRVQRFEDAMACFDAMLKKIKEREGLISEFLL